MLYHSFSLALVLVLFASCSKDKDDPVAPAPTNTCGVAGARLQANLDGEAFCADASLFASLAVDVLTVNGISQQGATLTLELDSLSVGTHTMTEGTNSLLFTTTLGLAYRTSDGDPGSVTITSHDTSAKRIQGTCSADLYSPLGGVPKVISGNFDLYYIE